MGKKRIAIIDDSKETPKKGRKIVKTGKEHGRITDMGAEALAEAERIKKKKEELTQLTAVLTQKRKRKRKIKKKRGKRYQRARQLVNPHQFYPLKEAIKLLKKVSITRFNGSVEVHLNVKKTGLKGEITFPYPTGKEEKIRIADENLLKELERGEINFTTLIASPTMMPKLLKFAKLLGPKGLMPNPKAGTISEEPEKLAQKFKGKIRFQTEAKAPLIHLTIGKINTPEKELAENFRALVETVGKKNIQKAVLAPTMGPGLKIDLTSF